MRRFIRFLVRKIPRPWLIRFSYLFRWLILPFYKGKAYVCPICGGEFRKMLPYGNKGEANRLCPKCLSLERHRLLFLFLKQKTDFFTHDLKVLHIAPEQPFLKRLKKLHNLDYTTADLVSPIADVKMDVMDMPFEDASFDVVLCNHVLEHVGDDRQAMREIYRVLKPGGWAVLQVPLNLNLKTTLEDPDVTTAKERERVFGQYDHVRWHGQDYPDRLRSAGFEVHTPDLSDTLTDDDFKRMRLPVGEYIPLAIKSEK